MEAQAWLLELPYVGCQASLPKMAEGLNTNAFLLSLWRFIGRYSILFEFLNDNGTKFVGGEHLLREAFKGMALTVGTQPGSSRQFLFNLHPTLPTKAGPNGRTARVNSPGARWF